jgi:hypothetical protein
MDGGTAVAPYIEYNLKVKFTPYEYFPYFSVQSQ